MLLELVFRNPSNLVKDGMIRSVYLPFGSVKCKKGPRKWVFQTILRRSMWCKKFFDNNLDRIDTIAKKTELVLAYDQGFARAAL